MRNTLRTLAILLCIASPALALAGEPILTVTGEVAKPLKLTAEAIAKMPRQTLKAVDHGGVEAEFTGVPLGEILKEAGVKMGQDLRGQGLALYLVVEATDGYKAVFALPELDPTFNDRVIILADTRDGKPLDEKHGPLRIVVPGEKKQARWVRNVIMLRIGKA